MFDAKTLLGYKNQEYTIIYAICIGNTFFTLGCSATTYTASDRPMDRQNFVTWCCQVEEDRAPSFFWGHYFDDFAKARADLLKRAAEEAEYQAACSSKVDLYKEFSEMYESAIKNQDNL